VGQERLLGHAEALMPALRALLMPFGGPHAPVDAMVVETGPGSFTGLRVGLAAARALALAWGGLPVSGVRSTLLVAAAVRTAGEGRRLRVALLAPRGQHWIETFGANGLASEGPPESVADGVADADGLLLAGSAVPSARQAGGAGAPDIAAAAALPRHLFGAADPLYVSAHATLA
jgi:tRNA threonylcarbamoyl adenosine modification protein YeaZ